MDEEISIIDNNTRNEKIRNFFIKNKKKLTISATVIIFILDCFLNNASGWKLSKTLGQWARMFVIFLPERGLTNELTTVCTSGSSGIFSFSRKKYY